MGGAIYLRNLVYTLAALPPAEQPQLQLLYDELAEPDLVDDLRNFAFVDPHLADRRVKTNARRVWGAAKRRAIEQDSNGQPWDYIGDSHQDLAVVAFQYQLPTRQTVNPWQRFIPPSLFWL